MPTRSQATTETSTVMRNTAVPNRTQLPNWRQSQLLRDEQDKSNVPLIVLLVGVVNRAMHLARFLSRITGSGG